MFKGACHCARVGWTLDAMNEAPTACSCTICRRYGVIWAYGHFGEDIHTTGETTVYRRADLGTIDFHFCSQCGCVTHWIAAAPGKDGRRMSAVNLRMTEPGAIEALEMNHFDGYDTCGAQRDGRTVKDMWF